MSRFKLFYTSLRYLIWRKRCAYFPAQIVAAPENCCQLHLHAKPAPLTYFCCSFDSLEWSLSPGFLADVIGCSCTAVGGIPSLITENALICYKPLTPLAQVYHHVTLAPPNVVGSSRFVGIGYPHSFWSPHVTISILCSIHHQFYRLPLSSVTLWSCWSTHCGSLPTHLWLVLMLLLTLFYVCFLWLNLHHTLYLHCSCFNHIQDASLDLGAREDTSLFTGGCCPCCSLGMG